MANPQHLEWLGEGVGAWNERMRWNEFRADLRGADLREAVLTGANLRQADLSGANLGEAVLSWADLRKADLSGAVLRKADLSRADLREAVLREAVLREAVLREAVLISTNVQSATRAVDTKDDGTALVTDLSVCHGLSQTQLEGMKGDSETRIPEGLTRPEHWPVWYGAKELEPSAQPPSLQKPTSPIPYTPPAEFNSEDFEITVQLKPERPEQRDAGATPIDLDQADRGRRGLAALAGTLCQTLRNYQREDQDVSNRVRAAEQLLVPTEALVQTLQDSREDFLPTLMQDYVEAIALGFAEDIHAFEGGDQGLFQRVIQRGRDLYPYYPELDAITDPANTRFIPDDFPFSATELHEEISAIVYSDEMGIHFTEKTKELLEAEEAARVPATQDAEKSKLARYTGIVGEMWREAKTWPA